MGCQPTASKTELLLKCRRPFASGTEIAPGETSEPMRYGSCIHKLLEHLLKGEGGSAADVCAKWGVEDIEAANSHARAAYDALMAWCEPEGNPFDAPFKVVATETPWATKILSPARVPPKTRDCGFEEEAHVYDLREGEIAGTPDIVLHSPLWGYVVVDLKTGDHGDWTEPAKIPQMRTLVLQARVRHRGGKARWGAAILHSMRHAPPMMYAEEVPHEESRVHLGMLKDALSRREDGSLTPGHWCFRCPAKEGCPSQDGAMLARAGGLVKVSTAQLLAEAVDPGKGHMLYQQMKAVMARYVEALKEEVRRGVVINRPDGKTLALVEKRREDISKASIVRALGKEAGDALIEELRAKGCVSESEWEELRAVDDK